jgi:nicotinamide-nucleotide amidase
MKPMFEAFVVPRLRTRPGREVRTRVLHCLGIGEGDLATRLGDLMQRGRTPLVGTTASGGVVSIRVRYEGDAGAAGAVMEETERLCRERAGAFVFGAEEERIESVLIDLLRQRGRKLVLVESCTGGMVGSLLTSVAGSSDVLLGGFVTYANEMKTALVGVPREMIEARGAVSEDVALAMARGGLERTSGATDALAITGVAGPGGGSVAKPVGTVFVARASREGTREVSCECRRLLITGGREDVRGRASRLALAMLRWHVLGETVPTVLWQVRGA